jgi:Uma2 family endonuclease
MPTVLEHAPVAADYLPPRKKWTREELDKMESLSLIDTAHLELVEGDLLSLMGKNQPHGDFLALLFEHLLAIFGSRKVNQEHSINVAPEDNPTSQPQPDLFVFRPEFTRYRGSIPQPSDLALVVEVADTSLAFDLTTKAGLYARAGIVEYWVVDIQGRRLLSHRQPANGAYESVKVYGPDEQIMPLESPGASLDLKKIFDPEA